MNTYLPNMKIKNLINYSLYGVCFLSPVLLCAQVRIGYDFYEKEYIEQHNIKSVIELHYSGEDDPLQHLEDTTGFDKKRIKFDKAGNILKRNEHSSEEVSVKGYAAYEKEEIEEVKDENGWVIERKYYYNEKYRYSELFERDDQGKVTKVFHKEDEVSAIHLEFFYDEQGNNTKTIVHDNPSLSLILRTFNDNNQLLTEKKFDTTDNISRLDSIIYDNFGNTTDRYYYDFREGLKILSDHYAFKYDSENRKIWSGRYHNKTGELTFHSEIKYNKQGNKSGRKDFVEGKLRKQIIWQYEYYNSSD